MCVSCVCLMCVIHTFSSHPKLQKKNENNNKLRRDTTSEVIAARWVSTGRRGHLVWIGRGHVSIQTNAPITSPSSPSSDLQSKLTLPIDPIIGTQTDVACCWWRCDDILACGFNCGESMINAGFLWLVSWSVWRLNGFRVSPRLVYGFINRFCAIYWWVNVLRLVSGQIQMCGWRNNLGLGCECWWWRLAALVLVVDVRIRSWAALVFVLGEDYSPHNPIIPIKCGFRVSFAFLILFAGAERVW